MTNPLLSILIPTITSRQKEFDVLTSNIYAELNKDGFIDEVEIKSICDNRMMTIGEKRELLYKEANGVYSIQLDDDDQLSRDAVGLILKAIKENPDVDCVTFEEYVNIDGKEYKSNHSNEYADWEGDGSSLLYDGFHFHRTVYFKDVIKTELAKSVPVPRLRWAEDHEYSKLLKPLIRTEFHISEQLYKYIHISSDPKERYGLDK